MADDGWNENAVSDAWDEPQKKEQITSAADNDGWNENAVSDAWDVPSTDNDGWSENKPTNAWDKPQPEDSSTAASTAEKAAKQKKSHAPGGYVNPERVKTGGSHDKISSEQLVEKMEKIRLNNAKIKQRQEQIEADKQAFSKVVELDTRRAAHLAQVQSQVNRSRDANARRKLDRSDNREWDAGKKSKEWEQHSHDSGRVKSARSGRGSYHPKEFPSGAAIISPSTKRNIKPHSDPDSDHVASTDATVNPPPKA